MEQRAEILARMLRIGYPVLIVVTVALALLARERRFFSLDLYLANQLQLFDNQFFAVVMGWASVPGYTAPAIVLTLGAVALLLIIHRPLDAAFAFGTFAGDLVSLLMKLLVARPRPSADLVTIIRATIGESFPSGHVIHYTVFYGFLFYVSYHACQRQALRIFLLSLLALPVILVGPSRVYLGAHWPSDVVGGYLVGFLVLVPFTVLYERALRARQGRAQTPQT